MRENSKKRIAVFISGRGSNFMAIEKHVAAGDINGDIAVVISDMGDADGLTYARQRGIEVKVFPWQPPRRAYFTEIMEFLEVMNIDLIVLAGFMRVLSDNIIDRYEHRIVNIHPALLPSFPGEQAQKQAFEYGVKYSGCTVHFVDEGVDTGPIIMQHVVPVLEDDDVEALSQRILEEEHKLFPEVIKLFCDNRLTVLGRRVHIHT